MSASNPPGQADQSLDPHWMLALILLVLVLIWAFWNAAHTQIATVYSWVRIGQFGIFALSRSPWGVLLGIVMLAGASGMLALKVAPQPARWVAIAGGYLSAEALLNQITGSVWGVFAGLALVVVGVTMMTLRLSPGIGRGVAYVGGLLTISRLVSGIFSSWFNFFLGSNPALIEIPHITQSSLIANVFTLLALNIPVGVWIMRRSLATNPTNHNHHGKARDYTLHTFTDEQAKHYPHLKLFRKLDLTNQSINAGKYRMADTEKQFAIKHKLLDRGTKANVFTINRERAADVFRGQLGRLWRAPKDLTKWEAAVLSVLLPRIAALDTKMSEKDYKAALETTDRMLSKFWKNAGDSYDKETDRIQLDMEEAIQVLRKYWTSRSVQGYFKRHAYVYTLIYAMLSDARRLGVLPPSEFRWLRVADRRLWLVIDNVGRITAFTEVAGIYAHFLNEIKRKRAIEKPAVDAAVKGLVEGVESYKFSEEELELVNTQLKEAEQQASVDPKTVAVQKQRLVLGMLKVRTPTLLDMIEVALVNERGELVHRQMCKPEVAVELIREQHEISDEQMAKIVGSPTSMEAKRKLLEVVNGHDLVAFYAEEVAMVPGIERSAASVRVLEDPDEPLDLQSTSLMEGITEGSLTIRAAETAAKLARQIWIKYQEAELRAEARRAAAPNGGA